MPVKLNPATLTGFVKGVKTVLVQIDALATGVVLTANENNWHVGQSNPFDLVAASLSGFAWDAVPSPQTMDTPFAVRVRAVDGGGSTVTSFNGAANLSALVPVAGATLGAGTTTTYPTLYAYYHDARSNSLYTAAELGGAGRLTALAFNVTSLGSLGEVLTNLTIRLKHTAATAPTTGTWDNTGWTQVYRASPTISAAGWVTFNFTTPFDYNGTSNLLVDLSFDRAASRPVNCTSMADPGLHPSARF